VNSGGTNSGGAGNWPDNAAYAARFGLTAFVTRLRSLSEAELFTNAGIPLVASIAFSSNKLSGADIKSTNGHLAVIVGFAGDGERYVVAVTYRLTPSGSLSDGVHTVSDLVATVFGAPVPAKVSIP